MKYLITILAVSSILLSGCMREQIHQGNRLKRGNVMQLKEGDTKFYVEQTLGTPALDNVLNSNRVVYYEEYEDEESGDMVKRGVEIIYDDAMRIKELRRFGFEAAGAE